MIIVGIDEVGRGCWAGPLVACALLLERPIDGLKDSKLISKRQRQILLPQINKNARYGLGWVTAQEIDAVGLTEAVRRAMLQAYVNLGEAADGIIIDGNYNFLENIKGSFALTGADRTVPEVSAASIIAKEARDAYMCQQAKIYTNYHFDKHVGYGTTLHLEALKKYGICELHRLSYKPVAAIVYE